MKVLVKVALFSTLWLTLAHAQSPSAEQLPPIELNSIGKDTVDAQPSSELPLPPLPLEALQTFVEVMARIKAEYVETVDDTELINKAIKGMLSELDPHSTFFEAEEFAAFQEMSLGEFEGLGIEVIAEDGLLRVIAPIDDSPAQKAGIQAGDLIIRIDETAVQSIATNEAIQLLRGEPGSQVTLTLIRTNETKPLKISLERDVIRSKSVRAEWLTEGYAYVRIGQFQERTSEELENALKDLTHSEPNAKLKGLVLDLRNNPGGLLAQAVKVSDLFLESGLVVYTQGQTEATREEFSATAGDILQNAPLIVLINSGSASAAEIVAGALQDHRRALLVGEKSFGKGSVQTVAPLIDGRGMKFTTARYYTPSGRSIQAEGIHPDVVLAPLSVKAQDTDMLGVREQDLAGHLEQNNAALRVESGNLTQLVTLAERDYVLYEALNLLKSMSYMDQQKQPIPALPVLK